MREEAAFLEDIAEPAPLRRQIDPLIGGEQHLAGDGDAAAIGPHEARQHVDERRLAGARAAIERGDALGRRGEARGEGEGAEAFLDVDFDHARPRMRRSRRRASSSEARSAAIASSTERMASRHAGVSPPGVCVSA